MRVSKTAQDEFHIIAITEPPTANFSTIDQIHPVVTNRKKPIPVILPTILIIPSAIMASAQTVGDDSKDPDIPGDVIPAGPVGIANELQHARSDISGIMMGTPAAITGSQTTLSLP